ncbi:hypothetical protein V1514DRAFT_320058 [Lipomyces japonicus]|uniref:uncharacterized protein n=1 Tax=Lipomyces japonicus TaxID=56871 RepID=UPI0034CDC5E3
MSDNKDLVKNLLEGVVDNPSLQGTNRNQRRVVPNAEPKASKLYLWTLGKKKKYVLPISFITISSVLFVTSLFSDSEPSKKLPESWDPRYAGMTDEQIQQMKQLEALDRRNS